MASEDLTDDGSHEKLLAESVKSLQDEEEEEDCIKLLLNALENEGNEDHEKWMERRQKLLADDKNDAADLKVYLKQKYGNLADKLDESVNGSVSELNASISKLNLPGKTVSYSNSGNATGKRTVAPAVLHRERLAMKLLKKHKSETGKIICGIVIILIILGVGGSLIFLAFMLDMEDLYILGGIFSGGGIAFTIAFIVIRCQASEQLEETDYSVLYKP